MNYLHRHKSDHQVIIPKNVVKSEVSSSGNIGKRQEEWFIRGTETVADVLIVKQYSEKIVYPPSGTIIALDPDIPPDLQKVFFIPRTEARQLRWKLNDLAIGETGKSMAWSPKRGKYNLALTDLQGRIIDSVNFEVRGAEQTDSDDINPP
jgi:penicillin-binding protein 1C